MKRKVVSVVASVLAGVGWVSLLLLLLGLTSNPRAASAIGETIQGQVRDAGGNPIAGAMVSAQPEPPPPGPIPPITPTVSDGAGNYTLTVPTGLYRVWASKFGFATEYYTNTFEINAAQMISVAPAANVANINFFLDPGGAITGFLKNALSQPITNAKVTAQPAGGGNWGIGSMPVDAAGIYTITGVPVGPFKVRAEAPGFVSEYFNNTLDVNTAQTVTISAGAIISNINFNLDLGGKITGSVKNLINQPITNAFVSANPVNGGPGYSGPVDVAGVYTLTGIPAGQFRVRAEAPGFAAKYFNNAYDLNTAQTLSMPLGGNLPNVNFALERAGSITGTVKNSGNNPIANAMVTASPANGVPWNKSAQTDPSGVYTITNLPPGLFKVRAEAFGYEQSFYNNKVDLNLADPVTVTADTTKGSINFTLNQAPQGGVMGMVFKPDGSPAVNAMVDAEYLGGTLHKGAPTGANGAFTVTGLITGVWRLRAQPPNEIGYLGFSSSRDMIVTLSTPSLLSLPAPLTLTVVNIAGRAVLPDGSPVGGAGVNIRMTVSNSFQTGTGTGPDGYFRVGGLPPGQYVIQLSPPWDKPGLQAPPSITRTIDFITSFVNLNTLTFTLPTKRLYAVVKNTSGTGVANVGVNANRRGSPGWASTQTNANGISVMDVSGGEWEVMISPGPAGNANWIYLGQSQIVQFANNTITESRLVTFTVQQANAYVTGRVLAPDCTSPAPAQGIGIEVRQANGMGNNAPIQAGGYFTVPVVAGQYVAFVLVDQKQYPTLSGPQIAPFEVSSGTAYSLGNICLFERTSGISGRVTGQTGSGIPGIRVHAWKQEGGWADGTTNNDGNYFLSVISGSWTVNVELPISSTFVSTRPPYQIQLTTNQSFTNANFTLLTTAGTVHGVLVDTNGQLLSSINAWAYARLDVPNVQPAASGPVEEGEFDLNLPTGTFRVGVNLPPNSGYSLANREQTVTVTTGSARTVTFTISVNNATLRGGFFTDISKTVPAVGLEGEVFAIGPNGAWQSTLINSTDGTYTITAAAGMWNLGYHLRSADYVNNPPPDTRATITAGQVTTYNFTIVAADATIEGYIRKPDNSPLNFAFAHAHRDRSQTSAAIDTGGLSQPSNGYFKIRVPSGGQYAVGAHAPAELGYIQPDRQIVTLTSGMTATITLTFKASNGKITGTVYYHNEAGNAVYGPGAWVWAFSPDGQHTGAPADLNGRFELNVVTGTRWYLGAGYHPADTNLFYKTITPTAINMTGTQTTQDLHIYLARAPMPPAIVATFDPSVGWSGVLSDGTQIDIPAGAMPTTDTVRIAITPVADELPNTLTARPFNYGYTIVAYEDSTGEQIVSSFNANVLITFYYTDADLTAGGVSEADLSPSYFSTTTNSWTEVDSFTVDTANNQITAQIDHFSKWSLTSSEETEASTTVNVYLPLIAR